MDSRMPIPGSMSTREFTACSKRICGSARRRSAIRPAPLQAGPRTAARLLARDFRGGPREYRGDALLFLARAVPFVSQREFEIAPCAMQFTRAAPFVVRFLAALLRVERPAHAVHALADPIELRKKGVRGR